MAEKLLGQRLDEFVKQNFYDPLGLPTLTYNPLQHGVARARIAPTENDTTFRRRQVWGTVHDQGAALVGGLAGHAGLFGTATDLAALLQMNLQAGYYGGQRYFRGPVVAEFIRGGSAVSRRGLGWDRADPAHGGGGGSGAGAGEHLRPHRLHGHLRLGRPEKQAGVHLPVEPGLPQRRQPTPRAVQHPHADARRGVPRLEAGDVRRAR